MSNHYRTVTGSALCLVALAVASPAYADSGYSVSDGAAEISVGIDPEEAMIWMNTFPVDPAGEYIDTITVAYGRVGGPTSANGAAVWILLYEDANGGSPQDAVLKWIFGTTVANHNTDVLNVYRVPTMLVHGHLVAAALFPNQTAARIYIGALDTTAPTIAGRSFTGYDVAIDPANLGALPEGQFGPVEDLGLTGNFRIEAHGRTVDDAAVSLTLGPGSAPGMLQLTWNGTQASFDVERSARADFLDGRVIAPGLTGTTHDDPTLNDGRLWFYRVR